MKKLHVLIDGGTTNTRISLLDKDKIITRERINVGATNGIAGKNTLLVAAVKQTLESFIKNYDCQITDVFCSGMITCEKGLHEVPHVIGPASIKKLVENIVKIKLKDISDQFYFYFVPGIKFCNQRNFGTDVMRGEETEITGIINLTSIDDRLAVLHFGSHNKLICVADGKISCSVTTIGGELFKAICKETILKDLFTNFDSSIKLDPTYVKMGFSDTQRLGLSRSLFLIRVHSVIEKTANLIQSFSYLYGAILATDIAGLTELLKMPNLSLILYGRNELVQALDDCKDLIWQNGNIPQIKKISYEESELLSVNGIQLIRKQYIQREG